MNLYFAFLAIMLLSNSGIYAALPPLYESLNEYRALLASQKLIDELSSADVIRDIKRDHKGFIITSTKKTLRADIIYERLEHPGPAKFHFDFQPSELNSIKELEEN